MTALIGGFFSVQKERFAAAWRELGADLKHSLNPNNSLVPLLPHRLIGTRIVSSSLNRYLTHLHALLSSAWRTLFDISGLYEV